MAIQHTTQGPGQVLRLPSLTSKGTLMTVSGLAAGLALVGLAKLVESQYVAHQIESAQNTYMVVHESLSPKQNADFQSYMASMQNVTNGNWPGVVTYNGLMGNYQTPLFLDDKVKE